MTIEDYAITETDDGEVLVRLTDNASIPWGEWDNRDWREYARLAGIEKEAEV